MPDCPNCGRSTMRTKDWACQWCGYPLISKAYKALDKTYRELQEEQKAQWKSSEPEFESYEDIEQDEPEGIEASEAYAVPQSGRQNAPETPPEPEPELEPEPESEPIITPPPAPYLEPSHELEPGPTPEEAPIVAPEPETIITPPPAAEAPPVSAPEPAPAAAPAPPADVPTPTLSNIKNGTQLTVDQLNELFSQDHKAAGAAFQGKTIIVYGQVSKVFVRDHIDVRYIILESLKQKGSWSVRCVFDKSAVPQLIRLDEGREVSVRGLYDGFSKNLILKDCQLV